MEKALAPLWGMYEDLYESKTDRTRDNLESSFKVHNLSQDQSKWEENYQKLVVDVNCLLDAQEQMAM